MTRLLDRLIRRDGYWEGMASGAAVLMSSYGSSDREPVLPQLTAWAQQAHSSSPIVFAASLKRIALFSEARLQYQAKDDKHLFGNQTLAKLEEPFGPGTTQGQLLARMEQDAFWAGQAYIWDPPGEDRLVRLRPDWVTIVSELVLVESGDPAHPGYYRRPIGYWFEPPKGLQNRAEGFMVPAAECVHWVPVGCTDPRADFRGMSPLTPAYRDVTGDDGLGKYKIKYLENNASPNLLIKYSQKLQPGTIDSLRERMTARYGGVDNAFKTLVLDQGADATIIGNSLSQMDFSNVMAAGTERILADCGVPGVLVGLEPLRGAGRGYEESMQNFAHLWAMPQWRSVCGALEKLLDIPAGNRLWYDTSDIAALQEGEQAKAQIALIHAQALLTLSQAGYTQDSAVKAVQSGDVSQLQGGAQPVQLAGRQPQHMLPQPPGSGPTPGLEPLPEGSSPRQPSPPGVSPGSNGRVTTAGRRPASVRRP